MAAESVANVATSAREATVLRSKTSRAVNWTPASFARETSWIATMLSPPSAKNESPTLTREVPRTSANRPASNSSMALRGATYSVDSAANTGSGSALRSSLPLAPTGISAITITASGTMYDGTARPTWTVMSSMSTSDPDSGTT
ncbi:hypothetical protein MLGJGCBP_02161 [Rhodococcus sp. T7]|nr:hypothetical protein MLGJGCBP_02161 [Rhodococcus sp. T7]